MPDAVRDVVLESFLVRQAEEGQRLAAASDLLTLWPLPELGGGPPTRYVAQYQCTGVLRLPRGSIGPVDTLFEIGVAFHADYLRQVHPARVVTWLGPHTICHPNIRPPFVCLGHVRPGTPLVDLLYEVYEIVTYNNWAPHDALDPAAAQWSRNHQHLLPVDRRPLKWRRAAGGGQEAQA